VRLRGLVLEAAAERGRVGRGDREPEARAGNLRAARLVAAAEAFEQVRDEVWVDALAAVLDDEAEALAVLRADLDWRLAVTKRVHDQVSGDALERSRVGDELAVPVDAHPDVVEPVGGDPRQQLLDRSVCWTSVPTSA
jgi:hypothetical protein